MGSFELYVRTLTGKKMVLHAASSDTIEVIKLRIQNKDGIPPHQQRLIYAGQELQDCRTLDYYRITCKSTVHLILNLMVGATNPFADVFNTSAVSTLAWSSSAPVWREAAPGLCVEGYCRNSSCKANGQMVIYNAGFTHFDLILEAASDNCRCPSCRKPFTVRGPLTAAFNNCQWKFSGIKLDGLGGRPRIVERRDWQLAGNQYERFSSDPSNQVDWTRLLIVTRSLPGDSVSNGGNGATDVRGHRGECSICYGKLWDPASDDAITTPCSHCFHRDCLRLWLQMGKTTCPYCRANISSITL